MLTKEYPTKPVRLKQLPVQLDYHLAPGHPVLTNKNQSEKKPQEASNFQALSSNAFQPSWTTRKPHEFLSPPIYPDLKPQN